MNVKVMHLFRCRLGVTHKELRTFLKRYYVIPSHSQEGTMTSGHSF